MHCPIGRLVNPPAAARCDCGCDVATSVIPELYLSHRDRAANHTHRAADLRVCIRAFATAGLLAATIIGLARLNGPRGLIGVATYLIGILAIVAVVVGGPLMLWKRVRADAGLLVAVGLGAWVGLYITLRAVL